MIRRLGAGRLFVRRRGCVGGWGRGAVFGAEILHQLLNLVIAEGIAERGHFLAAVKYLIGDFFGRPGLVGADIVEGRRFFCALKIDAVAVGAALVAEEDSAGPGRVLVIGGKGGGGGEDEKNGDEFKPGNHVIYFRMVEGGVVQTLGGAGRVAGGAGDGCRLSGWG